MRGLTLPEMRAAVLAAKSVSSKPVFVTATCDENGKTLTGTDVTAALVVLQGMGADAFGLNCSAGPDQMIRQLRRLKEYAHIPLIANPNPDIYKKLGVIGEHFGALGILTITPSEAAIIGADTATKAANVEVIFVDRFNGSLVIGGTVSDVEAAVKDVLRVLENLLQFTPTQITRT